MYQQILIYCVCAFVFLTVSRLAHCVWQRDRVRAVNGLGRILLGGLRIDTTTVGFAVVVPLLLAPWLNHLAWAQTLTGIWLGVFWFLLLLPEMSTPQFVLEYDVRPNRLYVDYLKHPKEVSGMLWKGYKLPVALALLVLGLLWWTGWTLFRGPFPDATVFWWPVALVLGLLGGAVSLLAIRGTLRHRPLNPSTVAFCGDSLLNSLALNSFYSVTYAIYSIKNERSTADLYGALPEKDVHTRVLKSAGLTDGAPDCGEPELPSLHRQLPAVQHARPLNIVLIVEESLGAQFVGNLGGKNLTPELDKLAQQGWNFQRAYATGTRSVRGLEAVVSGFPPAVSDAVLRLSGAQQNFYTLAQGLKPLNYRSHFVYGGEAHFDNMKGFFMGNGFDVLHERRDFVDPAFVGTWGASDEDMFAKVHDILSGAKDEPTLCLAFSVTNHTPWEYPAGRITPEGHPASAHNSVRYADWAIGQFFQKARQSDYWDNTIFLVVADHDARVAGADSIPLRHFHIPALILGGTVIPRQDSRIISQIDLPVTMLSLAGATTDHPMIGQDLMRTDTVDRAMMQYGDNFGYLHADLLTVLEPGKKYRQFRYQAPDQYQSVDLDAEQLAQARAHALWPDIMYTQRRYTLARKVLQLD